MIIFLKRGNFVENQGHIRLQLNNLNNLNLSEQADGTDENMFLKAVNGQDGCEVTLEAFGFSLCYHRDDYNFDDKIEPKAGQLSIFPAYFTHTHRGIVAPEEDKYIITGWFHYQLEGY